MKTIWLSKHLKNNSWFLQQVGPHVCPNYIPSTSKSYLNILSKTTAIVVSGCFCITNCLQGLKCYKQPPPTLPKRSEIKFQYLHDGIWCQHFLLHTGLLGRTTHDSKVTHGELSRYSFTWAWFSTDYDGLVFLLSVIIINPYVLVKVM